MSHDDAVRAVLRALTDLGPGVALSALATAQGAILAGIPDTQRRVDVAHHVAMGSLALSDKWHGVLKHTQKGGGTPNE